MLIHSKLFWHDVYSAIHSATHAMAHPDTVKALAECTAHLCYMLEREQDELQH
jgi:hypothetical protein